MSPCKQSAYPLNISVLHRLIQVAAQSKIYDIVNVLNHDKCVHRLMYKGIIHALEYYCVLFHRQCHVLMTQAS
jgi:hypothetical protein